MVNVIELPIKLPGRDLSVLELQLRQLGSFQIYGQGEVVSRGIPQEVVDASFPLYSFASGTNYFGASLVSQAINQYVGLNARLSIQLPKRDLASLTALGSIRLKEKVVEERMRYLEGREMIPPGDDLPVKFFNTVLWDVLHANFNQPLSYENVVELPPEKEKVGMSEAEHILKIRYRHPEVRDEIKRALEHALTLNGNNIALATRRMGIPKLSFYRDLQRLDVRFRERSKKGVVEEDESVLQKTRRVLEIYYKTPSSEPVLKKAYEEALRENGGDLTKTAGLVQNSPDRRASFYRHIRELGIEIDDLRTQIRYEPLTNKEEADPETNEDEEKTEEVISKVDPYEGLLQGVIADLEKKEREASPAEIEESVQEENPVLKNYPILDKAEARRGMSLVQHEAYKLARRLPARIDVKDLIGAGYVGFLDAKQKYDPTRNDNFEAYASIRIRGAILDELRELDWVPRSVRQKQKLLENAEKQIESEKADSATDEELAAHLNLTIDEYYRLSEQVKAVTVLSLDDLLAKVGTEDKNAFATSEDALASLLTREYVGAASEILGELSDKREKLVLTLYYQKDMRLKEIGNILGLTESRTCQIHQSGLRELKRILETKGFEPNKF
ncbi:MAG: RNA polymerase sigma factor FliA [Candidatus Nanoarchaeia archaeon]